MRNTIWIACVFLSLAIVLSGCTSRSSLKSSDPSEPEPADHPAEEADESSGEAQILSRQSYLEHESLGYIANDGASALGAGGSAIPNQEPYDLVFYENYGTNPFVSTEDENTSTFGMDVDTASYTIMRRYILDGNLPDGDSVRVEEFINYFEQDYPEPRGNDVFSISVEGAESEFGQPNYHLLRIGIKAKDVSLSERPAANMIFVVDVSGSMNREDRLEQVKRSLTMLADSLKRDDRVGLVIYGSQGSVISDLTSNHNDIMNAIAELQPAGSTNAEQGLSLAYDMARRNFESEKINRIILCSDGVANVGNTGADEILQQIKADAIDGITLTTIGFGMGNYNDVLMEKLANHGDGMYYYIDNPAEAERVFGGGATQMLHVLASDAKIQVEFNEDVVDRFRLLGYENRRLEEEDFEDDTVDAGEVGAGQTVTALYEVRIRDDAQDDSRADLATVRIRYLSFDTDEIETDEETIQVRDMTNEFDDASREFRFASAVAEFAEILKDSYWSADSSFSDVRRTAEACARGTEEQEFIELVEAAIRLEDT